MNIGQLARTQSMIYRIIDRGTNNSKSTSKTNNYSYNNKTNRYNYSKTSTSTAKSSGSDDLLSKLASSLGDTAMSSRVGDDMDSLLESMGISGLKGRTYSEMAQYQIRTQSENRVAQQQKAMESAAAEAASKVPSSFNVRQQYTPISDEATEAMQKLALDEAKNSMETPKADVNKRNDLIRDHLKDVQQSKRTAAYNTMNKVYESEKDRLASYIKQKDSNWNDWGDKFDTSILKDYKPGVNIFV